MQGRVITGGAAFVNDLKELLKAAPALLIRGGCARIMSTRNGEENLFSGLIKEIREGKRDYSPRRTTLDDAPAQGLYRRICLVRKSEWSAESGT